MADDKQHFWDIIAKIGVCMVTTKDGDVIRSRPMAPYIDTEARTIQFMTDSDSAKVFELDADEDIALSFADTGKMLFASVSGYGEVSRDQALIAELWGPYAEVFFGNDPEKADVAIVKVTPVQAEFWDNQKGYISLALEMGRAYFSEGGPNLGDNAKLSDVA
ncbi:pyridoxamine 5'-phosphate oxidase family protein [Yoonia litorea]|uniref:General stress protein 26 n=1 Tax=Yoonia litorea TaxID=1123755 RepID=A0A1I6M662_9RHOB|nr:pyridoxamine 5'-phosphate oxidase family protein [Yoonia litorea]SFS11210.1 General stress protein 26 [Yoonia litorea]